MRRLLMAEWRKLVGVRVLWGLLGLCVLANVALAAVYAGSEAPTIRAAGEVTRVIGTTVDDDAWQRFAAWYATREADGEDAAGERALAALAFAVESARDPFAGYDARSVGRRYATAVDGDADGADACGALSRLVRGKYELVETQAVRLSGVKAGLSLYAGEDTPSIHRGLCSTIIGGVTWEAIVAAVLAMALLLGMEHATGAEPMVMASLAGRRRVLAAKLTVGLATGVAGFVVLMAAALVPYVTLTDVTDLWASNVASGFNTMMTELAESQPFLTWADLTVGQYVALSMALSCAVVISFALLAGICGIYCRNSYAAVGLVAGLCLGLAAVLTICADNGWWGAYHLLSLNPMYALDVRARWFTDMGLKELVPWQETIAMTLSLLYLAAVLAVALRRGVHRDLS
ncbi:ABC-2 family transporter protein [Bifidobacterium lemurum]|uniref:ABC-2 family transporter protein n=2 Tax=Bifidobacterium lemurum TaxID=1603886 RepID=A0A261FSV4_9BIFI|nr:hypothetical protein [Bifidobacterium lemurum]OZG62262.1 ABC-2 family transporter protein [Bifidobacterium lemurum]